MSARTVPMGHGVIRRLLAIGEQHGATVVPESNAWWPEIRFTNTVRESLDEEEEYLYIMLVDDCFHISWRPCHGADPAATTELGMASSHVGSTYYNRPQDVAEAILILLATISGD